MRARACLGSRPLWLGPAIALSLVCALCSSAAAEPQLSGGLTVGYGARDLRDDPRGAFALGLRGSALFLRSRNRDGAVGPYVEALTLAFADLQLGGGVEALLPGFDEPAIVLSLGGLARRRPGSGGAEWQPGAAARAFVGFREHNFHSWYGMANGLFVEGRLGFGDAVTARQAEFVGGLQLDLALFALPFLLVWNAAR